MSGQGPRPVGGLLDGVRSIRTKLGLLVAVSVVSASLLAAFGAARNVHWLLTLPVAVAVSLLLTQVLAAGMVAPLQRLAEATQAMARGDLGRRSGVTGRDEVGRLGAAFDEMAGELSRVDAERRELLATVSHELRTPLAGMTAELENMVDGVVPADAEHLGRSLERAERMGELLRDLLELSRLDVGAASLSVRDTDLAALVSDCVGDVRASGRTAATKNLVPQDMRVMVDPARLRQLLANVLDNAARHTPAGGLVEVRAGRTDSSAGAESASGSSGWWLEVEDSGPGIPAEQREEVFARLRTDSGGGTGLGLAVSRWVATLHGGSLRFVDSRVGALMRLEMPDAPAPGAQTSVGERHPFAPAQVTAAAAPADASDRFVSAPAPAQVLAPAPAQTSAPAPATVAGRRPVWPPADESSAPRPVWRTAAVAALGGAVVGFDGPGLSWFIVLAMCGVVAWWSSPRRARPWTLTCSAFAAALLTVSTLYLSSDGYAVLGVVVAAATFFIGLTEARTLLGTVATGIAWPMSLLLGHRWIAAAFVPRGGLRTRAAVRTVAITGALVAILAALLGSADATFAAWLDALLPDVALDEGAVRVFAGLAIFGLTVAVVHMAVNPPDVEAERVRPAVARHRFEWLVPAVGAAFVLVAYLVSQAAVLFGGDDYVRRTTGMTYAESVHRGFAEIVLVSLLVLAIVWWTHARAGELASERRLARPVLAVLAAAGVLMAASAQWRLLAYAEAYGLSELRVLVGTFQAWLGFVLVAVLVMGAWGVSRHVTRVALLSGTAILTLLLAANPPALVAEHNITRAAEGRELDLGYLSELGPEATGVLARRLEPQVARCVLLTTQQVHQEGWRGWTWTRSRSDDLRSGLGPWPDASEQARCDSLLWDAWPTPAVEEQRRAPLRTS